MSNKLNDIKNNIIERFNNEEKPLDIIDNVIDKMCIYKDNGQQYDIRTNFDISIVKEEAKFLYQLFNEAYYPKNDDARKEALTNTLSNYIFHNDDYYLQEAFEQLS